MFYVPPLGVKGNLSLDICIHCSRLKQMEVDHQAEIDHPDYGLFPQRLGLPSPPPHHPFAPSPLHLSWHPAIHPLTTSFLPVRLRASWDRIVSFAKLRLGGVREGVCLGRSPYSDTNPFEGLISRQLLVPARNSKRLSDIFWS